MRLRVHITVLGMALLYVGCNQQEGVVTPEPEGSGTLEVSVVVTGSRSDPDGFSVVLTIAGQGEPKVEPVGSAGGMIQFTDLPEGMHSVLLDGLADNCTVEGNPRPSPITPDETYQVSFAVHCMGPGALLIKTVSEGDDLDADGYALAIEASSVRAQRIGVNDSILIPGEELSSDDVWTVGLREISDHCLLQSAVVPFQALVSSDPLQVRLPGDVTVRITFTVRCLTQSSAIAFENQAGDIGLLVLESGSVQSDPRLVSIVTNITNTNGVHGFGLALSPDRSRIVFTSCGDTYCDRLNLFSVGVNGSGRVKLTNSNPGFDHVGPQAWSPDGSRIVLTSAREGAREIYVMNADGSREVRLTTDGASARCGPAWSPDGSSIAFCREDGIYRMGPVPGSTSVRVVAGSGLSDPSWSPDGSRIAYSTYTTAAGSGVAVIGVDGSELVQLQPDYTSPSWSPGGAWIAVTRYTGGGPQMGIVRFEGNAFGEFRKLADGQTPSWR